MEKSIKQIMQIVLNEAITNSSWHTNIIRACDYCYDKKLLTNDESCRFVRYFNDNYPEPNFINRIKYKLKKKNWTYIRGQFMWHNGDREGQIKWLKTLIKRAF